MKTGDLVMKNIVNSILFMRPTKKIIYDREQFLIDKFGNSVFTVAEVASVFNIKKNATQSAINKLLKKGAVVVVEPRHSSTPAKYKLS